MAFDICTAYIAQPDVFPWAVQPLYFHRGVFPCDRDLFLDEQVAIVAACACAIWHPDVDVFVPRQRLHYVGGGNRDRAHQVAAQTLAAIRKYAPQAKVILNLADLHFLRELREAAAQSPGYSYGAAEETRRSEVATVMASDLTLSYSDFEIGILESQLPKGTKLARMPWVVDSPGRATPFAETRDILFLGGFGHNPNLKAVRFFAGEVMPQKSTDFYPKLLSGLTIYALD